MYSLEDDHETSSRYQREQLIARVRAENIEDEAEDMDDVDKKDSIQTIPIARRQIHTKKSNGTTGADKPDKKLALAALIVACISVFFTALDQTVVVTALPQIITDLNIPVTELDHAAWIISAYLLGFVVAMPLMGRVSDIYGRRRIFLLCLAIFGLGSIFCALAPQAGNAFGVSVFRFLPVDTSQPGLLWLIVARVIQAIGGGAIVPIAMALVGDFYEKEQRAVALGVIGAVTEAGGAIGPLYGALIVQHLGWQWIFYLNVPIVILLLIAVALLFPVGKKLHEGIDWAGALLLAASLTCLSTGLAQQGANLSPITTSTSNTQGSPLALSGAAIFLIIFILVEQKARWPIVDLTIFKRLAFTTSALVSLLVGATLIIAMTDIPIYVDTVQQGSVLDSGLALLRLTVMIPIGAFLGGWLCNRITSSVTAILGLLCTAAGFYLMSRWPIQVGWQEMTLSSACTGLGFGLVIAPIGTTAINAVRSSQAGMSTSIVTALRMVGMMLGLAILTSWAITYFSELVHSYTELPYSVNGNQLTNWSAGYAQHLIEAAHTVYTNVFFISMFICLAAIVPAFFLWNRKALQKVLQEELQQDIHESPTIPGTYNLRTSGRRTQVILIILLTILLIGSISYLARTNFSLKNQSTATSGNNQMNIQIALSQTALTSIFSSQLNLQQGILSNLNVIPQTNNGLSITFNININTDGIQRTLPIEVDGQIGLDQQKNLHLQIQQVKRDGIIADTTTDTSVQSALNLMLSSDVMPSLRSHLKNVQLVSVHTDNKVGCSKGTVFFILQIEAPLPQGITPGMLPGIVCFNGNIDLNKLFP